MRDELQTSEPSLFLTFELDPSAYLEDDDMQIQNEVFYDEKGEVDFDSFSFFDGDFYDTDKKHHKDRVMLILNLPSARNQTVKRQLPGEAARVERPGENSGFA